MLRSAAPTSPFSTSQSQTNTETTLTDEIEHDNCLAMPILNLAGRADPVVLGILRQETGRCHIRKLFVALVSTEVQSRFGLHRR